MRRDGVTVVWFWLVVLAAGASAASGPDAAGAAAASGEADAAPAADDVVDLGGGRYRLGAIRIDRNSASFEVPGAVLEIDTEAIPIEFLAVTRGGMKAYEAVIELDTDAVAFNLACLLIGLDPENATLPRYHFDPEPVRGDAVAVFVSWEAAGSTRRHPLTELIRSRGEEVTADWAYTGSAFAPDGSYLAETFGTLIGVVHDPDSIIQHRRGLGLGNYGAVTIDPETMPEPGTRVLVTVSRPDGGEDSDSGLSEK